MDKRQLEQSIEEQPVEEPPKKTKKELQAIEREKARIEREAAQKARKEALELQKQQREEARALEKQQREQAKIEKQRERDAAKEAKERERKVQREAKEREKEAQREAKEREKEAQRLAKEREKEAQREAKERERTAQQPGLGAFFSILKKPAPAASQTQGSGDAGSPPSDYELTFLKYHIKANCEIIDPRPPRESPADSLEWLKSHPPLPSVPSISAENLKTQLNLGHDPAEIMKNVRLRHIQLAETTRPAISVTVPDIDPDILAQLCLDPTAQILDLDYEYDSDLEWVAGDEDDEDLMEDEMSEDDGEDMSDIESFLASDDEGPMRKRAMMVSDPMIRWNDGSDPEFSQFSIRVFVPSPVQFGEYKVAAPMPATPKATTDLPTEAVTAILRGIQGHTGTKALLLESLYHNLHKEFSILTRSGLKSVVDTHAKREKAGWVINPEKLHLLG